MSAIFSKLFGKGNGICLLAFDSGGPGTYAQLLVVKEVMGVLATKLGVDEEELYAADHFEMMGGVGFGGLAAIMLGHLKMTVEEAIGGLLVVAAAVFRGEGVDKGFGPEVNLKNLRAAIEKILIDKGLPPDLAMNDTRSPSTQCKVVLYAATSVDVHQSYSFRTYFSPQSITNPTVVEAVCASIAVPSLFSPVSIGTELTEERFVGGALGGNNPILELLKEAIAVFRKDRLVAQIISLGSGCPGVLTLDAMAASEGISDLVKYMTVDAETLAKQLSTRLIDLDAYLRLNVDRGMENVTIDDWKKLGDIESHTITYLENPPIAKVIQTCARHLQERLGTITLGQINHSSYIKPTARAAPPVSPYFVVRHNALEVMLRHLVDQTTVPWKVFSITGETGCGKTQLVSYFLQNNQSQYIHKVFVDAGSLSSIKADLQTWARSLGDDHEQDVWEDGLQMLTKGPHRGHWIVIFDGANDPEVNLVPYLPKCPNGTIVITSQNRAISNLANTHHLEVGRMEKEEALEVLMKAARRKGPLADGEMKDAHTLMEEVDYVALALVQAGTYCHRLSSTVQGEFQPYTFTQYLDLFSKRRQDLIDKAEPSSRDNVKQGIYTTRDLWGKVIPKDAS